MKELAQAGRLILHTIFFLSAWLHIAAQQGELDMQSQNAITTQTTLPASPEAAGLGEYGNFPISPYTGTANISIPVHSIKGNRISLDVNINYQTGGIKVEDRGSGILGVGWAMNAGGSITRSVKGAPDMHYNYYDNASVFEDYLAEPPLSFDTYDFYYKTVNGEYETQPDTYFFSFNGRTGKFHIAADGEIILTEDSDLKIVPTFQNTFATIQPFEQFKILSKFVVTDEYGTKYHFEDAEYTVLQYDDQATGLENAAFLNHEYNSTWHLSKIQSHDGLEVIDFTYDAINDSYQPFTNLNNLEYRNFIVGLIGDNGCDVNENLSGAPGSSALDQNYILQRRFLKEIECKISGESREKLVFNYSDNPCNHAHSTDRRLDDIDIYLGSDASHHELTHHFTYDSCKSGRLFLKDTGLRSPDEADYGLRPPHTFEYHLTSLPSPNSFAQDKWGFYNGKSSNQTLLPDSSIPEITFDGADRSSNGNFAVARNLTKVTYPTGGYTRYNYEGNRIPNSNSRLTISDCPVPCAPTYESCQSDLSDCMANTCVAPTVGTYLIPQFTDMLISSGYFIVESDIICGSGPIPFTVDTLEQSLLVNQSNVIGIASVEIINANTGQSVGLYNETFQSSSFRDTIKITDVFDIEPSTSYTLIVKGSSARTEVNTKLGTFNPLPDIQIGGVRLKSIKHYDRNDDFLKGRIYKYISSGGISSGKIVQEPNFEQIGSYAWESPITLGGCGNCCGYGYTTVRLSSSPSYPLGSFDGSFYGYSRVEEIDLLNDSESSVEGKRVYRFHNNRKRGVDVDVVENGKLINLDMLDANGVLVKREQYQYAFDINEKQRENNFNGFIIGASQNQDNSNFLKQFSNGSYGWSVESGMIDNEIDDRFYETKWERSRNLNFVNYSTFLTQQLTTHYYYDNANQLTGQVESVKAYDYSTNLSVVQPSVITTVNSNEDVHRIEYSYPHTYPYNSTIRDALVDRNLLLPPWQTQIKYNGDVIDGQETRCSFYQSLNGSVSGSESPLLYPRFSFRFENTWDTPTGIQTIGALQSGNWDLQVEAREYDQHTGKPTKVRRTHWPLDDLYHYDDVGNLLSHEYGVYKSSWSYNANNYLLNTTTAIDGTSQSFTYDDLLRIERTKDNERNSTLAYDYIYASDYNGIKTSTSYPTLGNTNRTLDIYQFYDDIGRPYQSLNYAQGPTLEESVLTGQTYDKVGRIQYQYEPRAVSNVTTPQSLSGDKTSFSYDASPLNRTKTVTDPESWVSRTEYGTNESGEVSGYAPGELHKIDQYDGNNTRATSYTDKRGNAVLSKRYNLVNGQLTDHDNVQYFDGKDRLTTTIPPGSTISNPDLLFRKAYAGNDLLTYEYIPGKGAINYINSSRGQLIYRQDPLMKSHDADLHYAMRYDNYGNLIAEGWRSSDLPSNDDVSNGILNIQCAQHTYGTANNRAKGKLTSSSLDLITSNVSGENSGTAYTSFFSYNNAGLLSKKEYNHPLSQAGRSLVEEYVYDSADNQIQTIYDYTNITSQPIKYTISTAIDHANRIKGEYFGQGQSSQKELSAYSYDGKNLIDQLTIGEDAQTITYSYEKNRLLSGQSSEKFLSTLHYNDDNRGQIPRRNGDISACLWINNGTVRTFTYTYDGLDRLLDSKHFNSATSSYSSAYEYDMRGNLINLQRRNGSNQKIDDLDYTYTSGNRMHSIDDTASPSLNAQGYDGSSVRIYAYDANGNIRSDQSRGITTSYNHMDLPYQITKNNANKLKYHYDFGGTLLSIDQTDAGNTKTTHYIGNVEYEGTSIKRINHAHGFIELGNYPSSQINLHSAQNVTREYCSGVINSWQNLGSNADINYWAEECINLNPGFDIQLGGEMLADIKPYGKETFFWTIKDHKQNVRSILDDDGNVMHHMNYYPFNLRHDFNDAPAYEWNVEGALEMTGVAPHLDVMAFRVCDRLTGRFTSVDKLSAAMPNWNGYQMSFNNPMNYIDPTGLMPSTTYDGQELAKEKSGEREGRMARSKEASRIAQTEKEFPKINLGEEDIVSELLVGLRIFQNWHTNSESEENRINGFYSSEVEDYSLEEFSLNTSDLFNFYDYKTNFKDGSVGGGWASSGGNYISSESLGDDGEGIDYINILRDDRLLSHILFTDHIHPTNSKLSFRTIDLVGIEKFGNSTQPVNVLRIRFRNEDTFKAWRNFINASR